MSEIDKNIAESQRKKAESVRDNAQKRFDSLPPVAQAPTKHERCRKAKLERKLKEAKEAVVIALFREMHIKTPPATGRRRGLRL